MHLCLFFFVTFICFSSIQTQPNFTFDEFFNSSYFPLVSLSPNGQYVLVHRRRPAWELNTYENSLWLYETQGRTRKLITSQLSEMIKPKWSPSGDEFILMIDEEQGKNTTDKRLYLYSIRSSQLLSIDIGRQFPLAVTWSNDDASLYFATTLSQSNNNSEENSLYEAKWKDVIEYRRRKPTDSSTIYRLDILRTKQELTSKLNFVTNVNYTISELVFVSSEQKLIFASRSMIIDDLSIVEMFAIDVQNPSASLKRLTNNEAFEQNLQVSSDGKHVYYQIYTLSPTHGQFNNTQQRLYSVDVRNGRVERLGQDFDGNILGYAVRSESGVYILGQLGTNVHIYVQESPSKNTILQRGWNGTYDGISSSSLKRPSSIACLHSSFDRPEEVYFVEHIDRLESAQVITNENQLFTQRRLPQAKLYRWTNDEDGRSIEGILHYPPGRFEHKNLPLLVLMHGGPNDVSLNLFHANWLTWAPMAATDGWLVFEPNYRGSTGYGDEFLSEIRFQVLTRPGKDVLAGVNRLVADGIADPNRLTIGGFSYGGFLTNWLITQTTRFNAAVSGAGAVEQVSFWGLTDTPLYGNGLIGGFPWEIPQRYLSESAIYQLGKVRTPTHIVTGEKDIRVPAQQSQILERGLHSLNVPVKLLLFPNVGHSLRVNPWHGKIKVREELKWLAKYGHTSSLR